MTEALLLGQDGSPMVVSSTDQDELPTIVFVNPTARGGRAVKWISRIQRSFEELSYPVEFVQTKGADELEWAAREAIKGGKRLLLGMGGDGTFQVLVNAALGTDVVLGILPVGGGNDFAAALGMASDPLAAARQIVRGESRWVDLLRVYTADGRNRLYVGGGGLGLDAEAARFASGACRRLPGRLRYIASALRALVEFDGVEVRAEFPGNDLPAMKARALLAAALNTPTYGAGLRLAPGARIDDGCLDVVIVEELSVLEVSRLLPRLLWTGELKTTKVRRERVQRVRLIADRPCVFHGDGEPIGPAPVEIEVAARAIRVLTPPGG